MEKNAGPLYEGRRADRRTKHYRIGSNAVNSPHDVSTKIREHTGKKGFVIPTK